MLSVRERTKFKSGFGLQFNAETNQGQQSLAVIDLNAKPAPVVIQNVYFPTPQSVNVGVALAPQAEQDGGHLLYVSGGVENKIWMFRFTPGARPPITPASPGPNTRVEAPFIDVNGFATQAPTPRYNLPQFTGDWERGVFNFLPLWIGETLLYCYPTLLVSQMKTEWGSGVNPSKWG